jgi:putative salt-induced outer membrane protein
MNKNLIPLALLAALPACALADDGWSGTGELGFAATRGNAKSENLNAKLEFKKEDETWKDHFYLTALRSKGESTVTTVVDDEVVSVKNYDLTANRYEGGASVGYKLDERSYVVGALRYENDDFSPFDYQAVLSLGYGYTAIKNERTELSFEIGPGYKRFEPVLTSEAESDVVGRGLIGFRHRFNENTAFENTFLVEAGSDNTFYQNDAGLVVNMNKTLALKLGYQVRHNSDVAPGLKKTDQLMTTNLVYNF